MSNTATNSLINALANAEDVDVRSRDAAEKVRTALAPYDGKTISGNLKRIQTRVHELFPDAAFVSLDAVGSSHWSLVVSNAKETHQKGGYDHYITVCHGNVYRAEQFVEINSPQYRGVDDRHAARQALCADPDAIQRAAKLVQLREAARQAYANAARAVTSYLAEVETRLGFPAKDALKTAVENVWKEA